MKSNNQNPARRELEPFPFEDGIRILDIRYDPVFKAVFTRDTEKSRAALSDLISSLIGRIVSVENIVANEPATSFLGQKKIRYDISCMSENEEPIDVEMSFHPINDELNRIEYFASRLFVGQEIEGVEKTYSDLKETYQISILAQKSFFPDKNLTHTFLYYDPLTNVSLDGKIRIITLELEKTAFFISKPVEEMTNTEQWAAFFQYLTDEAKREKIKEIINHEEGIAMATNTLRQVSAEYEAYALQTSFMKGELDWRSGMKDAKREGLIEGRNEANLENARKMKADNMSISQISKYTGLSAEVISEL
jgi:predicted transposase/invertase (TIGR01784 family)